MDPNSSNQDNIAPTSHLVVPSPTADTQIPPLSQNSVPGDPAILPPSGPIPPRLFSQDNKDLPPLPPKEDGQSFDNLPKEKKINKKMAGLLVGLFLIVALPLTVLVSQQQQSTKSGAANTLGPDTVVAIVNGKSVYEKDIEKIALEQYDSDSIDRDALKDSLDTYIERAALDLEKTRLNITVPAAKITAQEGQGFSQTQAYYQALAEQVTLLDTKNWQVFTIGFWLPRSDERSDMTSDEKNKASKRLDDGLKALSDAQTQLATQKTPLDIARGLTAKYSSLSPILGVNGYLLVEMKDGSNLLDVTTPRVYTYEKSNVGQSFFDTLYSMKTAGQIKKSIYGSSSGGTVIKLIKANTTAQYDNYEAWLAAKKASLANIVYSL